MKLVTLVREKPSKGGAFSMEVPEQDVKKLLSEGWTIKQSVDDAKPESDEKGEVKDELKNSEENQAEKKSKTKAEKSGK